MKFFYSISLFVLIHSTALSHTLPDALPQTWQETQVWQEKFKYQLAENGITDVQIALSTKHPTEEFSVVAAKSKTDKNTIYIAKVLTGGELDASFGSSENRESLVESHNGIFMIHHPFLYLEWMKAGKKAWQSGGSDQFFHQHGDDWFCLKFVKWEYRDKYSSSTDHVEIILNWNGDYVSHYNWATD
jgi:hypothetical protein